MLFVLAWGLVGLSLSFNISFHGLTYTHPEFYPTHIEATRWDLLGDTLAQQAQPNDALVVSVGGYVYWTHTGDAEYYTYGKTSRLLLLETKGVDPAGFPDFIHGAGRVWMARNAAQPPSDQYTAMESALAAQSYRPCGEPQTSGGVLLTLYSAAPQCCAKPQTMIGHFGEIASLGYTQVTEQNGSIAVWQGWDVMTHQHEAYSIGVFAFDESGAVVGQRDMPLPAAGYSCLLSEFSSSAVHPTLRLTVYDWSTGVRVPMAEGDANQLFTLP